MPRAQIEISRDSVKVRDIAIRPRHIEMEIIPKSKDPDKPIRQWKSRGIHLGLWDPDLLKQISELFIRAAGHENAIHWATEEIFSWFDRGVVFEFASAESPHDFDVTLLADKEVAVSNLADSR